MFAKSAATLSTASASAQNSKVVVSQLMDANDCKYIAYRASLVRLLELKRLLNILVPNLKKRSSPDKAIVPLVTYMLPLLEGSVFNINSTIKEKYDQIVSGVSADDKENSNGNSKKKEYDVTPRDWLTYIMDARVDNNVDEMKVDQVEFKKRLYDKDGQWETISHLLKLVDETIALYNNKFKSANLIKRNYAKILEDLLRPSELSLCLDLAVLITDYEKDTSEASFKKLQWQVIDKFLTNIHTKVEPTLKSYYKALIGYQQGKLKLYNLPFPEHTIHRMFAFTIRMLELMEVFTSEVRVLYYANMTSLKDIKTKLVSENLYEYDLMIKQLEKLCSDPLYQIKSSKEIMQFLQKYPYSLPKSLPEKTHELFTKKIISKLINIWNTNTELVQKWVNMWKFCDKNTSAREKIETSSEDQISKMYEERYTVDELAYLEKEEKKNSGKKTVGMLMKSSNSSSPSLSPNKTPKKKVSITGLPRPGVKLSRTTSGSGSNSNSNLSSGVATPTERSRRSSVDQGFSRPTRLPQLTKTNTADKMSAPLIHISENSSVANSVSSSATGSPSVSRRGSVIDENAIKKTVVNRTIERKKTKTGNRPRSASLQANDSRSNSVITGASVQNTNSRFLKPNSIQSQVRSNSLESNSALNQKMVQDTFKHLMTTSSQKSITNNQSPSASPLRPSSPSLSRSNSNKTSNAVTSPETKSKLRTAINKPSLEANENNTIKVSPLPHEQPNGITKKTETTNNVSSLGKESKDKEYVLTSGNDNKTSVTVNVVDTSEVNNENTNPEFNDNDLETTESTKKVRFVGVPPMTDAENPPPTRKGWYKKPAVLHYPPVPKQVAVFGDRLRQEGMVFRTSLRDTVVATSSEVNKKSSMMLNFALDNPPVKEISSHSRFASKLREKLTR